MLALSEQLGLQRCLASVNAVCGQTLAVLHLLAPPLYSLSFAPMVAWELPMDSLTKGGSLLMEGTFRRWGRSLRLVTHFLPLLLQSWW